MLARHAAPVPLYLPWRLACRPDLGGLTLQVGLGRAAVSWSHAVPAKHGIAGKTTREALLLMWLTGVRPRKYAQCPTKERGSLVLQSEMTCLSPLHQSTFTFQYPAAGHSLRAEGQSRQRLGNERTLGI